MLNVCLIGLGPMGKRHLTAIKQIDEFKIVAAVERNEHTLHSICDEYGIPNECRFTSYEDAFAKNKPDIVAIATNGPSHYPIFKDVVNAGVKMVLCEKPIATSLSDAREMDMLAKSNGVTLIVNHARRWCEDYIHLKQQLAQGLIGKVESYMFSMGGGQLGCNATHFIDLIIFLSDQQTSSVSGFLNDENVPNPRGEQFKDPGGYALIHLKDNTRVFFEMTEDLGIPPILIINGTYGRIIIEETKGRYTVEKRSKENENLPITRYGTVLSEHYSVPFENLDIIALTKKAYELFGEERELEMERHAYHALETVIAFHYSNEQSNRAVELPLEDAKILNRMFSFT